MADGLQFTLSAVEGKDETRTLAHAATHFLVFVSGLPNPSTRDSISQRMYAVSILLTRSLAHYCV